ncbi:hypothetical protein [Stenotrophomonas maltophilia]|uniref:hypothetical protein n=1 Tax=Stenotrophomonas maltophilia TaxID=40324 RepID=UPI0034DB6C07
MRPRSHRRLPAERVDERSDPRLRRVVPQLALAGLAVVLVWPAARGSSVWLGWLPLWLVGMPLAAWWALLRCPLPSPAVLRWLRGRGAQAQRRRPARARSARAAAA